VIAKAFDASDWIPLVRTLVAGVPLVPGTYDDAVQEVLLYIHEKAQRGIFVDVRRAVRWALADWRRGNGCDFIKIPRTLYDQGALRKNVLSLGTGRPSDTGRDDQDFCQIEDPSPADYKSIDDRLEVEVYLNWVNTNEAFVLRNGLLTGGDLSDKQCGRELGLSESRCSQLRSEGLKKIQDRLRSLRKLPGSPCSS